MPSDDDGSWGNDPDLPAPKRRETRERIDALRAKLGRLTGPERRELQSLVDREEEIRKRAKAGA